LAAHYRSRHQEPPETLEGMNLNDYVMLLRYQGTWAKFSPGFGASAEMAYARLAEIPELRNAVFHFRRDLTAEEYDRLRTCRDWLLMRVRKAVAAGKASQNA